MEKEMTWEVADEIMNSLCLMALFAGENLDEAENYGRECFVKLMDEWQEKKGFTWNVLEPEE